jgi:hypothetical protein
VSDHDSSLNPISAPAPKPSPFLLEADPVYLRRREGDRFSR